MKIKQILTITITMVVLMVAMTCGAATSYTFNVTSGDWNNNANWNPSTGHPIAGDTAIIPTGKTVTGLGGVDQACATLTVQGTGILNIDSGRTLNVSGVFTLGNSVSVAYLTNNGTLNLNGTGTSFICDASVLTNTAGSIFTCAGGNTGNANDASPTFGNNGTATFTGATVPFSTGNKKFLVVQGPNGVLNLNNSVASFGNSAQATFTAVGNTVNYGFAGTQSPVGGGASISAYYNLTLSASGAKTTGAATVNGTLSLQGTATMSSTVTYGAGATLEYKGSSAQTAAANEFPATSGPASLTINNSAGVSLAALSRTITGTLTLTSGALSKTSGGLTLGNGATISRAAGSLSSLTPTFTTSVNVTYNDVSSTTTGSELPTSSTVLNNLTINNLAGVVLNANATVNGTFTATYASGTPALAAGANTLALGAHPVNITVSGSALTSGAYTIVSSSGTTVSGALGTLTVTGSGAPYSPTPTASTGTGKLVLTITAPSPSITGAATATAFTTTYGTASTAQSFLVSGANLTANLVATAPAGYEVSSDGTTYGGTATFTQSGGSASGTLRIRLAATAAVSGSYDSQNIVLSSTGATSVNITTAASGDTVARATATFTVTPYNVVFDGNPHAATVGTITGVNGETGATVGTVDLSGTTHTSSGTYASDGWSFTGPNYNSQSGTITDTINGSCTAAGIVGGINASATTLCAGSPVILTLTNATGSGPLLYQWQTNGASIPNATNASYTNLSTAVSDSFDYTCVVTNACGSITSSVVTLTVNPLPSAPTGGSVTNTYDGAAHTGTATPAGGSGVKWFTAASGGSVTTAPSGTAAGTYTAYAAATNSSSGCESATRTLVTVQIDKATASVTVASYSVTYDGSAHSAVVTSITGVNGETGATVGTVNLSSTTHTAAGAYGSDSWSFAGANYNTISATTISNNIAQATATVTVTPYNVTFNGSPHTATASITGVNGETGATVGTVNLSGTTHTAAGTYASDGWSFTGANYVSQSGTVTDTITAAPIAYALTNSGAWNVPANWSPNGTPGSIDTVTINSGKTLTVLGGTNQSCASLTVQDTGIVNIESGVALAVSNTLTMGSVNGVAYLTNNGTFSVTGTGNSFVFIDGSVITNTAGSTFTCAGGNSANANASPVFGNNGTATFTGATIPFDTGFHNFTVIQGPNGVLNLNNSVAAFGNSATLNATAVGNTVSYGFAGAQSATSQSGTASYYNLTYSGSGAKSGAVTVNGTLSLQGTATAGSTVTYGAGATLAYNGTGITTTTSSELPAIVPNLTINSGIAMTLGANTAVTGTLTLTSGTLTLNGKTLSAGSVLRTGGSIVLTPAVTLNSYVYDGTTGPTTIATRSLTGTLTGDSGNVSLGASGTVSGFTNVNVGSYTQIVSGLTLSGASATNYSLSTTSVSSTASITKATATVTVTPYNVTYDGNPHTASAGTVTGVNGETGATVGTVNLAGTTHTVGGTYASDTWSLTGGANYNNIPATTITDIIAQTSATLSVASSENPSGFGDAVSFTATLPAGATGNVVFFTNGISLCTSAIQSGVATSIPVLILPRGTNTVTAQYAGDNTYLGITNSLANGQVVTNHPPVAVNDSFSRGSGISMKIPFSMLLANDTDADPGDTVSFVSADSTTTNGTPLIVTNGVIFVAPSSLADAFTYTIQDGYGGSSTGTVSITVTSTFGQQASVTPTSSNATVVFFGVPGMTYLVERATDVSFTSGINFFPSVQAPSNGVFNVVDDFSDLGSVPGSAFYRLLTPSN